MNKPLNHADCLKLAETLGDRPETTIQIHLLRHGFCWAYVVGEPSKFDGVIIQSKLDPAEPTGYGSDAKVLWSILKSLKDWDCIEVPNECAKELGEIITSETGRKVRYYGDVYHALLKPANRFENEFVRQITLDDLDLLKSSQEDFRRSCFDTSERLLTEGFAACAIVSGEIVGVAHTSARGVKHSDIGVFVAEGYRERGFATASASIVAQKVQEDRQIPVWSAGETNFASLRVAQKLGFAKLSTMTYVIPEKS